MSEDPRHDPMNDDSEVRNLFSAIVAVQPTYEDTTSVAAHKGRRIRRRRQVTAAVGGLGLAAVVALVVPALLTEDVVSTENPRVAERPTEPVPDVTSASATTAPPRGGRVTPAPLATGPGRPLALPDPAQNQYCGAVTAVDPARGTVTFRAYASYTYGGESPTFTRPETATFTVPVTADTTVSDFAGGEPRQVGGDVRRKLELVRRAASGDKRAYFEMGDKQVSSIDLNRTEPLTTNGCLDSHLPDPARTHYCGVIDDVQGDTVVLGALASYVRRGETSSFRQEIAQIRAQAEADTPVFDASGAAVPGDLGARLAQARRAATAESDVRAVLGIQSGVIDEIRLVPATGDAAEGCPAR